MGWHSIFVYIHTPNVGWWSKQISVTIAPPTFPADSAASLVPRIANTDGQTYLFDEVLIVNNDREYSMTDIRLYDYHITGRPPRQASDEVPLRLDKTFLRPGEQAKWGIYLYGADAGVYALVMSQMYSRTVYMTWRWVSPDGIQSDVRRREVVLW